MSAACLSVFFKLKVRPKPMASLLGARAVARKRCVIPRCGTDVSFHVFPMFPCTVCALRIVCVVSSGLVALLRSAEDADVTELLRLRFRPWTSTQWVEATTRLGWTRTKINQQEPTRLSISLICTVTNMKEHEATTHHIAIVCHISGCYALDSVPKTSSGHSPEGALSFSCAGGLVWRSAGSTVNMGRRTKDVGWKHFVPDWRERPFWNCIDSILVLCLGAHLVYYLRVHRVNSPLNLF